MIAALVAQLIVIYDQSRSGEPFLSWIFILSTSVAQCLAIITACVPYLKRFMQSLNSGMIGNDDLRRRGGSSTHENSYNLKKLLPQSNGILPTTYGSARTEAFVTAESDKSRQRPWDKSSQTSTWQFIRQT